LAKSSRVIDSDLGSLTTTIELDPGESGKDNEKDKKEGIKKN
jgi:hypothetical protein